MTTTDAEDLVSFVEGTKNAGNKLVRKYKAASAKTLKRLQDPKTKEAWEKAMADEQTKKAYEVGTKSVTAQDLENGMSEKGKSNYETSTGSKTAQQKWLNNGKPYRDVAKSFSENKPVATTTQEKVANMAQNMINQINVKRRELGLPELS